MPISGSIPVVVTATGGGASPAMIWSAGDYLSLGNWLKDRGNYDDTKMFQHYYDGSGSPPRHPTGKISGDGGDFGLGGATPSLVSVLPAHAGPVGLPASTAALRLQVTAPIACGTAFSPTLRPDYQAGWPNQVGSFGSTQRGLYRKIWAEYWWRFDGPSDPSGPWYTGLPSASCAQAAGQKMLFSRVAQTNVVPEKRFRYSIMAGETNGIAFWPTNSNGVIRPVGFSVNDGVWHRLRLLTWCSTPTTALSVAVTSGASSLPIRVPGTTTLPVSDPTEYLNGMVMRLGLPVGGGVGENVTVAGPPVGGILPLVGQIVGSYGIDAPLNAFNGRAGHQWDALPAVIDAANEPTGGMGQWGAYLIDNNGAGGARTTYGLECAQASYWSAPPFWDF